MDGGFLVKFVVEQRFEMQPQS